jgi:hypothetical protein
MNESWTEYFRRLHDEADDRQRLWWAVCGLGVGIMANTVFILIHVLVTR